MRGRGAAFLLGRASAKNAQEPQSEDSSTTELKELANLHNKGILTDKEFSAAKKKVLGGK